MLPPLVARVLVVLLNVIAPDPAVKAALLPKAVCRVKAPRSAKAMDVCAVTLMWLAAPIDARAPVDNVPGVPPPSLAATVPPDAIRKASSVPEPAAPGRMVMLVAGVRRSSALRAKAAP